MNNTPNYQLENISLDDLSIVLKLSENLLKIDKLVKDYILLKKEEMKEKEGTLSTIEDEELIKEIKNSLINDLVKYEPNFNEIKFLLDMTISKLLKNDYSWKTFIFNKLDKNILSQSSLEEYAILDSALSELKTIRAFVRSLFFNQFYENRNDIIKINVREDGFQPLIQYFNETGIGVKNLDNYVYLGSYQINETTGGIDTDHFINLTLQHDPDGGVVVISNIKEEDFKNNLEIDVIEGAFSTSLSHINRLNRPFYKTISKDGEITYTAIIPFYSYSKIKYSMTKRNESLLTNPINIDVYCKKYGILNQIKDNILILKKGEDGIFRGTIQLSYEYLHKAPPENFYPITIDADGELNIEEIILKPKIRQKIETESSKLHETVLKLSTTSPYKEKIDDEGFHQELEYSNDFSLFLKNAIYGYRTCNVIDIEVKLNESQSSTVKNVVLSYLTIESERF